MAAQKRVARKKKIKRAYTKGIAHIHSTFNNTIVTITDEAGNAGTTVLFINQIVIILEKEKLEKKLNVIFKIINGKENFGIFKFRILRNLSTLIAMIFARMNAGCVTGPVAGETVGRAQHNR